MELSIQERLKDLRVERGLTLEQLEEQVNLSKSALGSYEAKDFKDISHYSKASSRVKKMNTRLYSSSQPFRTDSPIRSSISPYRILASEDMRR